MCSFITSKVSTWFPLWAKWSRTCVRREWGKSNILIMYGDFGFISSSTHYNYNHNLFHRAKVLLQRISALPVKQKATSWPLAHGAQVLEQAGTNRCFLIGHRTSVGWGISEMSFGCRCACGKWYFYMYYSIYRLYTCVVYLDVYDTVPMKYRKTTKTWLIPETPKMFLGCQGTV